MTKQNKVQILTPFQQKMLVGIITAALAILFMFSWYFSQVMPAYSSSDMVNISPWGLLYLGFVTFGPVMIIVVLLVLLIMRFSRRSQG